MQLSEKLCRKICRRKIYCRKNLRISLKQSVITSPDCSRSRWQFIYNVGLRWLPVESLQTGPAYSILQGPHIQHHMPDDTTTLSQNLAHHARLFEYTIFIFLAFIDIFFLYYASFDYLSLVLWRYCGIIPSQTLPPFSNLQGPITSHPIPSPYMVRHLADLVTPFHRSQHRPLITSNSSISPPSSTPFSSLSTLFNSPFRHVI